MKRLCTLMLLVSSIFQLQAQRYKDKVFTDVTLDSVSYGNANNWNNTPQELKMNIFQPQGDTATNRPLLILAHGGAFINGNRYAPDVEYLCREFAKRGYVCVSISYRLGIDISKFFLNPGPQFANAVWRGTHDGRAAVRFLRVNAATYKIDKDQIYMGGVSAGGVLGLHEAFLDLPAEVGSANPTIDTVSIGGGIEGNSGTPGQSWRVKGLINLCGGIGDGVWMSNNRDISIFNVHGTKDETVPYKTDYFRAYNMNVAKLSGSFTVDSMAKIFGMKSFLYTFVDAPHVPFSPGNGTVMSSTAYMDTTERLMVDFLVEDMGRKVGLPDVLHAVDVLMYPNPAHQYVTIEVAKGKTMQVTVYDINGKVHANMSATKTHLVFNTEALPSGLYFVNISNEYGSITRRIAVE
ncbi:MAG: T9SS type A sorting domain-containing protein [Bacteroidota bacterium]